LHSEYLRIAPTIDAAEFQKLTERVAPILEKRKKKELNWDAVYTFDLEILAHLSDEDLVRKAYDMRSKYRSIAGARDYDSYIASKPPDLTTLQIESIKKTDDKSAVATEVLRADIRYLLSQFYLHYSLMPLREGLRDDLTRRARNWTLIFLGIFAILLISSQILIARYAEPVAALTGVVTSTVGVVVFAGIMGGCVSMLQRIQSAPNEGDALYNLAALSHGWKGISLSPLYGAIFAILLYILFTAGILQGAVFPNIKTLQVTSTTTTPSPSPTQPGTASAAHETSPATAPATTTSSPTLSSSPTSSSAPSSALAPKSLPFSDTGPADGKAYALLVIWSFIAGFAERLVPDTLNRLVAKNQSIQGTNT
jgi:Ca2+/Na+ antiporter